MTRPPYLFLSYARADFNDGPYLKRFFTDLRHEVRTRCGHPSAEEVGFLDTSSIQAGQAWSDELANALGKCRTFVAICSRTFFTSEYCGREWQVFSDRLRATAGLPALLPVIWTPLRPPPTILARLQYNHEDLGACYAENGLRYLLQLNRNHDEYQEFLVALAERIVHLAEESPLPAMTKAPDFHLVRNAFGPAAPPDPQEPPDPPDPPGPSAPPTTPTPGAPSSPQPVPPTSPPERDDARDIPRMADRTRAPRPGPDFWIGRSRELQRTAAQAPGHKVAATSDPEGGGPKRVTFVFAVTSARTLSALRQQLDYYGNDFDDWAPYHPHFQQRVCIAAQAVAASQEMASSIMPLRAEITELLERSRERNEIVVFVVDVWTAKLEPFRTALIEYDRRNEPTTGVLVPWNPDDVETVENATELRAALAEALPNNMVRRDTLFRMDIASPEEFTTALVQLLADSQARIFSSRASLRTRDTPARRRPLLQGP
ncbi:TIR-like protein FxsC [Frankia sp. AgB32]|uniref:TIR-like protein FxsC n=1 Tax=Frankia sp. AgB32 TaxID=631119 RepID=UPI00201000F3|nr:TIR-like protein FxsC [Frankia sp. AgB32]MCK9893018.1 TIR-like protein FxsC [Frankia sp. AgB32]